VPPRQLASTLPVFGVCLEQQSIIGKGFTSDVYSWKEGRVLKLFHKGIARAVVEREFRATRAVHELGLPVPATYEPVEVDGRFGIVLERIHGVSLLEQVQARPWTLLRAAQQLAELQAKIHACEAPGELISQREWIQVGIGTAPNLPEEEKQQALHCLDSLPDGKALCHGDFHPANILVTSGGPVIIDWGTATRGHPLGDVACTSRLMQTANLPHWAPFYAHLLLKMSRSLLHRTYLRRYLRVHPGTRREIKQWEQAIGAARGWRVELPVQQ
jgi:uncharacterized protein (TIGR02172 family)